MSIMLKARALGTFFLEQVESLCRERAHPLSPADVSLSNTSSTNPFPTMTRLHITAPRFGDLLT